MKTKSIRMIILLSNIVYVACCVVLYLVALCILGSSVYTIISDMRATVYTVYTILDEVALIVFAMAVIDVAKYLIMEEVIGKGRTQLPQQTRKTLGKFAVIIASALSLEGLVLTIEVAKQDVTKLLYPVAVLITATLFIIGIGVYQFLNRRSEETRRRCATIPTYKSEE